MRKMHTRQFCHVYFILFIFIMMTLALFTACRNNTTCLPLNWGGEHTPGGTPGNGGLTLIFPPFPGILNVYRQIEWLHDNSNHIQGGPNRVYVVTAHAPNLLPPLPPNPEILESNGPGSNVTLTPGDPANIGNIVRIRIVSSEPGTQREISIGDATRWFTVGNNNTLELYDVAVAGLSPNTNPAVDVVSGGTLRMRDNSAVRNNSGRGVRVHGGTFYMYNGAMITENTGGVIVENSGEFTMNLGAVIYDNNVTGAAVQGGGVIVQGNSTFTMNAGALIDYNSSADSFGGGVVIRTGGEFTMYGGTISRNHGGGGGGGVAVHGDQLVGGAVGGATFIMRGGSIVDNNVTANSNGGGVWLTGGANGAGYFRMYNGTISGNGWTFGSPIGGGVAVQGGSRFYMHDGNIYNNRGIHGGGVEVINNLSNFTMFNGTIGHTDPSLGNYTNLNGGGGVTVRLSGTFVMHDGAILNNRTAGAQGAGVNITNGTVANPSTFTMHNGTISGNAFTVTNGTGAGVRMTGGTVVVPGPSALFTMNNGLITGHITTAPTRHRANNGGGVFLTGPGAKFYMNGGTISGNHANAGGGGVFVLSAARFTMTDGEISANEVVTAAGVAGAAGAGGGVHLSNETNTFTMTGGTILNNTAFINGGGVFVFGESTFNFNNGIIEGNTANGIALNQGGGGVHVAGINPHFSMGGGLIRNNTAASQGGGVHVLGANSTFTMIGGTILGTPLPLGERNNAIGAQVGGFFSHSLRLEGVTLVNITIPATVPPIAPTINIAQTIP